MPIGPSEGVFLFVWKHTCAFFLCTTKIGFLKWRMFYYYFPTLISTNIYSNQISFDNPLQGAIDYLGLVLRAAHVIANVNRFTYANKKCILLQQSSAYHTCKCTFM